MARARERWMDRGGERVRKALMWFMCFCENHDITFIASALVSIRRDDLRRHILQWRELHVRRV